MDLQKEKTEGCGEFISMLLWARTQAHVWHLQTTSFAEHKELNAFYDAILAFTDTFAETSIGAYGRPMFTNFAEIVQYADADIPKFLDVLKSEALVHKGEIDSPDLINMLDELVALLNSTKYRLTLS